MELISLELIKTHIEEIPIWKLCFAISQGKKDTLGQIQEKMVWSIHLFVNF